MKKIEQKELMSLDQHYSFTEQDSEKNLIIQIYQKKNRGLGFLERDVLQSLIRLEYNAGDQPTVACFQELEVLSDLTTDSRISLLKRIDDFATQHYQSRIETPSLKYDEDKLYKAYVGLDQNWYWRMDENNHEIGRFVKMLPLKSFATKLNGQDFSISIFSYFVKSGRGRWFYVTAYPSAHPLPYYKLVLRRAGSNETKLVGELSLQLDQPQLIVYNIETDEEYQRIGVATHLLEVATDLGQLVGAKQLGIGTVVDHKPFWDAMTQKGGWTKTKNEKYTKDLKAS